MSGSPGADAARPAAPTARPIRGLLDAVPELRLLASTEGVTVSGCTHNSRAVRPGDIYAALPGAHAHGADFAEAALAAGAAAVLTDAAGASRFSGAAPVLVADDPRAVLGDVASWVHGHPARDLLMLGVTGTNGKTTTAFLLEAGLRAAGHRTALIGTLTRIEGELVDQAWITNPEATDLHAFLALMRERGVSAVAMEVSSHALVLGRVNGVVFDVAAFTNLSRDHLEFHATMQDYEQAKAQLFTSRRSRRAVLNCADPAGRRILHSTDLPFTTYGEDGEWQARMIDLRPEGSSFRLTGPTGDYRAAVRIPGAFNVDNAVCAIATLVTAGLPVEAAIAGVADLAGVPGRMERVEAGQAFLAVVDYAHTPEAVSTLLAAVRPVTSGRLIAVLGCGGDRDRGKRPLMAKAAADGADVVVLTSDNPRSEDPLAILAEMAPGAPEATIVADRREAIEAAVRQARPGDAVVVMGKGHETGQEVDGVVTPFDDRLVLQAAVRACSS